MSNEQGKWLVRYYVIRSGRGHTILKVEGKDIESFLELLGDLIEASGDTHEEAMEDFANSRLPMKKKRRWWWQK